MLNKILFSTDDLECSSHVYKEKAQLSLGTLGGGNHFIEIDKDSSGDYYITVHSGSRHMGKEVAEYYLNEGRRALKDSGIDVPYELIYLEGQLMSSYLAASRFLAYTIM